MRNRFDEQLERLQRGNDQMGACARMPSAAATGPDEG